MRIGSDAHKERFCRWFIDTHREYEAEDLRWPDLDDASIERLRAVPVWSNVVAFEERAGCLLEEFASQQTDPLLREAIAVQGFEEERHGRIFSNMLERYGIIVADEHVPYEPTAAYFTEFGYKECLDAFLGYGAFRLARDSAFLPDSFLSMFVDFMDEETRHIIFFVNWVAYDRARRNASSVRRAYETARGYFRAVTMLAGTVRGASNGSGFMGGDGFIGLSPAGFIETCVRENDRHMSRYRSGLLQPRVIPTLARVALGVMSAADYIHGVAHGGSNGRSGLSI